MKSEVQNLLLTTYVCMFATILFQFTNKLVLSRHNVKPTLSPNNI